MKAFKAIPVLLLLAAGWSCAQAADRFVTIQRGRSDVVNAAGWSRGFTLPTNVNRSATIANSAVLELEVAGSTLDYNEVFVNPDSMTCKNAGGGPSNSIGYLQPHKDVNMDNEWATNHKAFDSSLLKTGTDTANVLLICVRDANGTLLGNVDNIAIRSIVLQYHTTQ